MKGTLKPWELEKLYDRGIYPDLPGSVKRWEGRLPDQPGEILDEKFTPTLQQAVEILQKHCPVPRNIPDMYELGYEPTEEQKERIFWLLDKLDLSSRGAEKVFCSNRYPEDFRRIYSAEIQREMQPLLRSIKSKNTPERGKRMGEIYEALTRPIILEPTLLDVVKPGDYFRAQHIRSENKNLEREIMSRTETYIPRPMAPVEAWARIASGREFHEGLENNFSEYTNAGEPNHAETRIRAERVLSYDLSLCEESDFKSGLFLCGKVLDVKKEGITADVYIATVNDPEIVFGTLRNIPSDNLFLRPSYMEQGFQFSFSQRRGIINLNSFHSFEVSNEDFRPENDEEFRKSVTYADILSGGTAGGHGDVLLGEYLLWKGLYQRREEMESFRSHLSLDSHPDNAHRIYGRWHDEWYSLTGCNTLAHIDDFFHNPSEAEKLVNAFRSNPEDLFSLAFLLNEGEGYLSEREPIKS